MVGHTHSTFQLSRPSRQAGRGRSESWSWLRSRLVLLPALFCLGAFTLAGWPLDTLVIRNNQAVLFSAPAPLGQEYRTRYIHSLQRTPVVDVYHVLQGRIWQWQEWIQSHNAGLPSLPPARGRFFSSPPWMVMEGGGAAWSSLVYRVGNAELGRNEFAYSPGPWIPLYRTYDGQRLEFSVANLPLFRAFSRLVSP